MDTTSDHNSTGDRNIIAKYTPVKNASFVSSLIIDYFFFGSNGIMLVSVAFHTPFVSL